MPTVRFNESVAGARPLTHSLIHAQHDQKVGLKAVIPIKIAWQYFAAMKPWAFTLAIAGCYQVRIKDDKGVEKVASSADVASSAELAAGFTAGDGANYDAAHAAVGDAMPRCTKARPPKHIHPWRWLMSPTGEFGPCAVISEPYG